MSSFSRRPGSPAGNVRRHNADNPVRKRVWFGPGTVLALLIAGGAIAMQAASRPPQSGLNAGLVTYAADNSGHLRRVEAGGGTAIPTPAMPLWKPEVSLLLAPSLELSLTDQQRRAVTVLDLDWKRDKQSLEASLRDAAGDTAAVLDRTDSEHGAPLKVVREGLRDYSALSREYDARRADYWSRATAILSAAQRAKVERMADGSAPGRAAQ